MNAVVEQPKKTKIVLPPATILDCTPEEYLKDPCESPSLSASTAHKLISQSPLHAWSSHPKYAPGAEDEDDLESDDEDTVAKSNGSIVHKLILGKGAEITIVNADSWRTKVAKELRDEAKKAGRIPVLEERYDELTKVVTVLRSRCSDMGYDFNGRSEVPIQWYDYGQQGPVLCRSMIDHGWLENGVAVDFKTIRSANPDHINRTFVDHGYHVQDRAYTRAIERLYPDLQGRVDMTFLFAEIKPPYAIVAYQPDGAAIEIGKQHWDRAVRVWETCLKTNQWPSYCTSRIVGETPNYQVIRHLGKDWVA
jgi:ATP-dependent exoDNAse (exonuclease V) beta subunit